LYVLGYLFKNLPVIVSGFGTFAIHSLKIVSLICNAWSWLASILTLLLYHKSPAAALYRAIHHYLPVAVLLCGTGTTVKYIIFALFVFRTRKFACNHMAGFALVVLAVFVILKKMVSTFAGVLLSNISSTAFRLIF
jgi:hypothetical protein